MYSALDILKKLNYNREKKLKKVKKTKRNDKHSPLFFLQPTVEMRFEKLQECIIWALKYE